MRRDETGPAARTAERGRHGRGRRRARLGAVTVVALALVVFDSVATYLHLTLGLAVEGNVVVARMIEQWGAAAGLTLRTLQVAALVLGLSWLARRSGAARHGLVGVTIVLGVVAVYHLVGPALLV